MHIAVRSGRENTSWFACSKGCQGLFEVHIYNERYWCFPPTTHVQGVLKQWNICPNTAQSRFYKHGNCSIRYVIFSPRKKKFWHVLVYFIFIHSTNFWVPYIISLQMIEWLVQNKSEGIWYVLFAPNLRYFCCSFGETRKRICSHMPIIRMATLTAIIPTHYFTDTFNCPFFKLTAHQSLILYRLLHIVSHEQCSVISSGSAWMWHRTDSLVYKNCFFGLCPYVTAESSLNLVTTMWLAYTKLLRIGT